MIKQNWIPIDQGGDGAGGQVWVAYRNPHHPDGWNLIVEWTPLGPSTAHLAWHLAEFWMPVDRPDPPPRD